MARAIILGAVDAGACLPDRISVVELEEAKRAFFEARGIRAFASAEEGLGRLTTTESRPGDGHILLAIKPQSLAGMAAELRPLLDREGNSRPVVSILAGTPTSKLESALGDRARILRAMPNLPARIRKGTTAIAGGRSWQGPWTQARSLFGALGQVVEIQESLFDAFTAIAGSGPAYVFYLAEALTRAAVAQGFDAAQADVIVRSVLAGSSDLLARESDRQAVELRASVTSKGGTTAAAVSVLDQAGLQEVIVNAIAAATRRGRELAEM